MKVKKFGHPSCRKKQMNKINMARLIVNAMTVRPDSQIYSFVLRFLKRNKYSAISIYCTSAFHSTHNIKAFELELCKIQDHWNWKIIDYFQIIDNFFFIRRICYFLNVSFLTIRQSLVRINFKYSDKLIVIALHLKNNFRSLHY